MDKKAFIKHLSSLLLFGLNGIVASHINLNSYEIVLLRTFIGSALLAFLFLSGKRKFHIKENKRDALFVTLSGIAMGASWMFLYEAYQQIGVSLATILYYCGPVIIMIFSPIIFREKLTTPKVIGFLIVLMGIIFVNGNFTENNNIWGLFCAGMSAITYFFMVILNKKSKQIVGLENSVIQLLLSFIAVAAFVGIKQGLIISIPSNNWGWILMLGIVNTGLGCYMYFSSLSKLPAQTVAICGYLEPLAALLFATFLLGEKLSLLQCIGTACIVGGAIICETMKPNK